MQNVITLVTSPHTPLGQATIDKVSSFLQGKGATEVKQTWLSPKEACDIFFTGIPLTTAFPSVKQLLGNLPIDCIAQPVTHRQKKLYISDMDSTIIAQECIDELAGFVGLKEKVSAITARTMNGELDFSTSLKERVALLKGLPLAKLEETYQKKITFSPGARTLVQTLRAHNVYCLLVSGGFTFFTERVATALGFNAHHANHLETKDGHLTGHVIPPILDKQSKWQSLQDTTHMLGISLVETIATGDGANDLPMLQAAGLGIAYYAKPFVKEKVNATIDHTTLKTILFFQGYTPHQFHYDTHAT